jgi:hypothetical protein
MIDFYGTLKEIIKLDYTGEGEERSVVLFKCDGIYVLAVYFP